MNVIDQPLTYEEKVSVIKSIIVAWQDSNTIDDLVKSLLKHFQVEDTPYQKAIFFASWVKDTIKFVPEPPYFNDRVRTPLSTLKGGFGDCSEHVILLGSLLANQGIDFSLIACATDGTMPNTINHVYIEVKVNGCRVPLDTTSAVTPLGQEPMSFIKIRFK